MDVTDIQLPNLRQLVEAFSFEFPVTIVPPNETREEELLMVALSEDAQGRAPELELSFLPHEDGVFFLQYYVALPSKIDTEKKADIARLIAHINAKLPLTGFGFLEELPLLFFRCIIPCADRSLDEDIHIHTAYVLESILAQFSPIIESLGNGTASLEESKTQFAMYTGQ